MEQTVTCPHCDKANKLEIDTTYVTNRTVYNDLVDCKCGNPFIVKTTFKTEREILTVSPPEKQRDWSWMQRGKKLMADLEKHLS